MDEGKLCLLTHVLRGAGIDSEMINAVEKLLSSVELPPLDVFHRNLPWYNRVGLRIVPVDDYVFNVFEQGDDRPSMTIFYNNDYKYSIDTCTLDTEKLGRLVGKISSTTMKIMAIDKVEREIETFQRLLDRYAGTPYYDCLVKLIISMASQSRWVW